MKCCICGKEFNGYGNNPYPVGWDVYTDEDRCCDDCNERYVIPARIARLAIKNTGEIGAGLDDELMEILKGNE